MASVLTGRQIESYFYQERVLPYLYGLYSLTLDFHGTAGQLVSAAFIHALYQADADEINLLLFDNYELGMMRGEAYNFYDLSIYWGQI
ncbi:MAG: hypothetical protein ACFFC6_11705 [Promethearchaeota archaeon]